MNSLEDLPILNFIEKSIFAYTFTVTKNINHTFVKDQLGIINFIAEEIFNQFFSKFPKLDKRIEYDKLLLEFISVS